MFDAVVYDGGEVDRNSSGEGDLQLPLVSFSSSVSQRGEIYSVRALDHLTVKILLEAVESKGESLYILYPSNLSDYSLVASVYIILGNTDASRVPMTTDGASNGSLTDCFVWIIN